MRRSENDPQQPLNARLRNKPKQTFRPAQPVNECRRRHAWARMCAVRKLFILMSPVNKNIRNFTDMIGT